MPTAAGNPLLQPWDTPFGLPPFESIRPEHFAPAFEHACREHLAEIDAIAHDPAPPDFENTAAVLDRAGRLFHRIEHVFHNLTASATSPALQQAERELAPRLAAHANAIYLNRALFERLDALHAQRESAGLAPEQRRLLERLHLDFVRAGARLPQAQRTRHAQITERLAELQTRFGQNVLADESGFVLELRGEAELAGLPDFVRAAARQAAAERSLPEGVHAVTLSRSLIVPFLTFSERRDLREQAWRAWTSRGEHPGEHDNRPVAREILALRLELARALGYASYADYALADSMAGTPAAVDRLLQQVWQRATLAVARERAALQTLQAAIGEAGAIEPWDWRRLAERLRQRRFGLDEAEVKPYFPLDRMVEAVFDCAQRLFGLRFVAQPQLRAYHPDVKVYEVRDAAGATVGVFLHDNFARPNKRSGAWMSQLRMQTRNAAPGGGSELPIVLNNNNFARGAAGEPTLLSFDDARTLFHEFGHGLHGLLSSVTYERLAGTNVRRDFVELPSQLFEHWLTEPTVLKAHARHVHTNAPIPDTLVERLKAAHRADQGYDTVRYTASALLDMAIHAHTEPGGPDITAFEGELLARIGLPEGVGLNHRLPHFQHLFSGDAYAAGYYVYLWAEVLDADGFDAFAEAGDPFDPAVAQRLRQYVYAAGDSIEPGAAYRAFRGRDAAIEPMLRQRGLVEA
ncbi:M3 family metallopeptidase [Piscinibacter defluvii]|uniref:M3 family metallopeptidase n=1 Tax=Piscinibacter defluvii TaxID=1796922 RepID=UPI000FDF5147|nr:M3 family metallopeptidase [Piscinibacter defluvii]